MKRKVLMLLTNPFRPDPRVYQEAQVLIEGGYGVDILCWDRGEGYPSKEVIENINIYRLHIPSSYGIPEDVVIGLIKFYYHALVFARRREYHIVHAHDFDTLPIGVILKKLKKANLVYDAHDHYSSMIEDVLPRSLARFMGSLERFLINFTDVRIAATPQLGRLIFGDNYVTILNAKDLKDYNVDVHRVESLRRDLFGNCDFLIVYIGILKRWTPLPTIIRAVKKLDNVCLAIGGDGPHREEILQMIDGRKNIKYLGWIKKDLIPLYTMASDIIVLPSNNKKKYTQVSIPNKILGALAAGKPIIAGTGTAGEDIVKECNCGFSCPFGDVSCLIEKIRFFQSNKDLMKSYGENARRCAEKKYNWSIMAGRLLNLYSGLSD